MDYACACVVTKDYSQLGYKVWGVSPHPAPRCYCKDLCSRNTCHHPDSMLPHYLEDLIPNLSTVLYQDPNNFLSRFNRLSVSVYATTLRSSLQCFRLNLALILSDIVHLLTWCSVHHTVQTCLSYWKKLQGSYSRGLVPSPLRSPFFHNWDLSVDCVLEKARPKAFKWW